MKFLKVLVGLIVIVIIVLVGVGGYLGFIPGIAQIFGSDKPSDLGKSYSETSLQNGIQKSGSHLGELPNDTPLSQSIKFEGSHPVEAEFSDDELTSAAYNRPWIKYPFKNVQIRINADNSVESSGIVKLPIITGWLSAIGVSSDQLQQVLDRYHIPMAEIPFYAKARGQAANNILSFQIEKLEAGRVPVPSSVISTYQPALVNFVNDGISRWPGLFIEKAEFTSGKLQFKGTLPDKELTLNQ